MLSYIIRVSLDPTDGPETINKNKKKQKERKGKKKKFSYLDIKANRPARATQSLPVACPQRKSLLVSDDPLTASKEGIYTYFEIKIVSRFLVMKPRFSISLERVLKTEHPSEIKMLY